MSVDWIHIVKCSNTEYRMTENYLATNSQLQGHVSIA